jgi:hypothetical protein
MLGSVPMHLITADAENILRASYLIYSIAELSWGKKERQGMFTELRGLLNAMDSNAEYTERLNGAAFRLQGTDDSSGEKPRHRRKKA